MSAQSERIRLRYEQERIAKIHDPVPRAKEARRLQRVLEDFRIEFADITKAAVLSMREDYGWSQSECAEAVGVSRQRIQQIVNA